MVHPLPHSPLTQVSPVPQELPSASDHAVALRSGLHTWHTFTGFASPLSQALLSMTQPARHWPWTQEPVEQVPLVAEVQAVVDVAGTHLKHSLSALAAPAE